MTEYEYKIKSEQLEKLRKEIDEENKKRRLSKVHKNAKFVGKCFVRQMSPKTKEYYKVLSEYSENEYRVECLKFKLPFKANISRILAMHGSRYPDCTIEALPFETESVMIKDIFENNCALSEWKEISESEFYDHMDICYSQFVGWTKLENIISENGNELVFKKQKED